jgi:hypothetical protein
MLKLNILILIATLSICIEGFASTETPEQTQICVASSDDFIKNELSDCNTGDKLAWVPSSKDLRAEISQIAASSVIVQFCDLRYPVTFLPKRGVFCIYLFTEKITRRN